MNINKLIPVLLTGAAVFLLTEKKDWVEEVKWGKNSKKDDWEDTNWEEEFPLEEIILGMQIEGGVEKDAAKALELVKSNLRKEPYYYTTRRDLGVSYRAESDSAKLKKYEKTYGKEGAKVRLKLLKSIKKRDTHGTKSGQWSARKSQLLTKEYEAAMNKKGRNPYKSSKRTKEQQNLKDWGDQKWRTKSGKKSSVTGERYLPEKAIKALTDEEYKKTTAAKRKAKRAGKQFSKQPKEIAKKVAKYRAEYKIGTQGPCWDGYTYVGPKPYAKGSCRKD